MRMGEALLPGQRVCQKIWSLKVGGQARGLHIVLIAEISKDSALIEGKLWWKPSQKSRAAWYRVPRFKRPCLHLDTRS